MKITPLRAQNAAQIHTLAVNFSIRQYKLDTDTDCEFVGIHWVFMFERMATDPLLNCPKKDNYLSAIINGDQIDGAAPHRQGFP